VLLQTLIPLDHTPNQKSPTPPKRAQSALILRPARLLIPKGRTERKPDSTNQVPEPNMPAQGPKRWDIPAPLCLDHEEKTRDNKTGPANDLGGPEYEDLGEARKVVVYAWQGGETSDPEDGGADELGEGS